MNLITPISFNTFLCPMFANKFMWHYLEIALLCHVCEPLHGFLLNLVWRDPIDIVGQFFLSEFFKHNPCYKTKLKLVHFYICIPDTFLLNIFQCVYFTEESGEVVQCLSTMS
jgi:hypothetical protein